MNNNFDLKGYMQENKVGSYQQLNEMWYSDIKPISNFASINEEEQLEDSTYQDMVDDIVAKANGDTEQEYDFTIEALKQHQMQDKDQLRNLYKFAVGANYHSIADAVKDAMTGKAGLQEKGDVKSIGDAGKMAHANTRTNLGRHRSSDMLDKMSKKDHDKNTVVGAKAAAYKAPHMNEFEMFGAEPQGSDLQTYIDDLGHSPSVEDLVDYYQKNGLAIGEMQELMNHYGISVPQVATVIKALKADGEQEKPALTKPELPMYEAEEDPFGAIKTGIDKIAQGGQEEMEGDYDRIMDLGGEQIEKGIISLMDDGFDAKDIMDLCKMLVNARRGGRHSQY